MIRPLAEHEKQLRAKYLGRVRECEVAVQRAAVELQQAKEVLNDLTFALGGGPCVMTAEALHEAER